MNPGRILIVKVHIDQTKFDPGAMDTQIYCINSGDDELIISFKSESFTTINEESGDVALHGTADHQFVLASQDVKLIAEVAGWEWDGHVGMEISIRKNESKSVRLQRYDFKTSSGNYFIEPLKLYGRIIPPLPYSSANN